MDFLVFSLVEVTEQKRSNEENERMFSLTGVMVCIANLEGYFKKISPAFEETLGYSREELLSKPYLDYIHPDDVDKTIAVIEEKLKKGEEVFKFENRYRCKDGSYRWFEWTSRPLIEEGITFANVYDITERKEAIKLLLAEDPETKVIVSSGYSNDPVVSNYKEFGFSGYLNKPYKMPMLSKVLSDVINGPEK